MGQLAGNLGNKNVTDPNQAQWGDLDNSEKGARLIAGGTRGLAQGFSNYQQQNSQLRRPGGGMLPGGNNLNFYGGPNG